MSRGVWVVVLKSMWVLLEVLEGFGLPSTLASIARGVAGNRNVPSNSVSQLKAAINQGVVTVTIEADQMVFQQYQSGVLDTPACGTNLDHAVAAVGYGTEGGKDYYIVRNSWSAAWGDQGYIKIAAVEGAGICGIQMNSLYPTTD
jgi:cathepsin L